MEKQLEMVETDVETLAIYGTDDMFTGIGKYRSWVKGKSEKQKFKAIEVEGAGHFWMQESDTGAPAFLKTSRRWNTWPPPRGCIRNCCAP